MAVLSVLGILGMLGIYGFTTATDRADEGASQHAVRSVVVAEQLRYQNRGAFTDDPLALAGLEPSWSYVTVADGPGEVSVSTGRHQDMEAVAVAAWSEGRCVGAVAFDPELAETITSRWDPASGSCSGADAFTNAGESSW